MYRRIKANTPIILYFAVLALHARVCVLTIACIEHNVMSGIFTYAFIYWAENENVNVLPWGKKHSYSNTVAQAFSFHEYLQTCPHQERQILASKLALLYK